VASLYEAGLECRPYGVSKGVRAARPEDGGCERGALGKCMSGGDEASCWKISPWTCVLPCEDREK